MIFKSFLSLALVWLEWKNKGWCEVAKIEVYEQYIAGSLNVK